MSLQASSDPHEACLLLLRAYFSEDIEPVTTEVLARVHPEDFVRVSTFAYLHTVLSFVFEKHPTLAETIDSDAIVYLHEMRRENARRNAKILEQIRELGGALARLGVKGVALKGAAELLRPTDANAGRRFLSDVDLLLGATDVEAGQAALASLGAVKQRKDDGHLFGQHHLAPFWHDDWLAPVELHVATGRPEIEAAVPGKDILLEAEGVAPGLCVPTNTQRIAHLVLHAQFSDQRWARAQLSPRDLLEAAMFQRQFGTNAVSEASRMLSDAGQGGANEDFWNAVGALCLGQTAANSWTKRATDNFLQPDRQRTWLIKDRIAQMAQTFVHSPSGRRRYLKSALSGRAWRGLVREFAALRHRTR